jgi:arylsulfatase
MKNHLESEPESPFFMWASFPKPHSAFDPPRPYDKMYDPREMPEPIGSIELLKERGLGYICARENMYMWRFFSPEARKLIKAYYYGLISHQDMQVGRLLDFLRKKNIEENTLVIYTADHGEMLGDFGIYFKTCFYSGSVKIPLIIKYPGVFPAGLNSDVPAGLQDILPTFLAAAGLKPGHDVDGFDLAGVIRRGKAERQYYVSQCFEPPNQQYMAADKNWKYIYHQRGGIEELYSLNEDPHELNNLFQSSRADASAVRRRMREYVIEWCRENGDRQMLGAHGLVKAEPESPKDFKDAPNPHGRRFY